MILCYAENMSIDKNTTNKRFKIYQKVAFKTLLKYIIA